MNNGLYYELKPIIDHYGEQAQKIQAVEEMSELIKELCKNINGRAIDKEHITEEMADVIIMIEQLKIIYNNKETVNKVIAEKIKRTQERIKER